MGEQSIPIPPSCYMVLILSSVNGEFVKRLETGEMEE